MLKNSDDRYGLLSRALHWITALLIAALFIVGLYMTGLDKADPDRRTIFGMHKAMGALTMMLLIVRLAWLAYSRAPALPDAFTDKEKRVTKGLRFLLYILLLAVPFSGYVMSGANGYPVSFFGLFDLPMLFGKSKALAEFAHEAHEYLAWGIAALAVIHAAAAVKYRLVERGGERDVLQRML